jgi:hypothetical protein
MSCPIHGESAETLPDGQCRECVKDETLSFCDGFVHGRRVGTASSTEPPLAYIPFLVLGPRDIPSLADPTSDPKAVQDLRDLIALSYCHMSQMLQQGGRHADAIGWVMAGLGFQPKWPFALAHLHYEYATALKDIINAEGAFNRPAPPENRIPVLMNMYAHADLAYTYHLACKPDEKESTKEIGDYARNLLRALHEWAKFGVIGHKLVGPYIPGGVADLDDLKRRASSLGPPQQ